MHKALWVILSFVIGSSATDCSIIPLSISDAYTLYDEGEIDSTCLNSYTRLLIDPVDPVRKGLFELSELTGEQFPSLREIYELMPLDSSKLALLYKRYPYLIECEHLIDWQNALSGNPVSGVVKTSLTQKENYVKGVFNTSVTLKERFHILMQFYGVDTGVFLQKRRISYKRGDSRVVLGSIVPSFLNTVLFPVKCYTLSNEESMIYGNGRYMNGGLYKGVFKNFSLETGGMILPAEYGSYAFVSHRISPLSYSIGVLLYSQDEGEVQAIIGGAFEATQKGFKVSAFRDAASRAWASRVLYKKSKRGIQKGFELVYAKDLRYLHTLGFTRKYKKYSECGDLLGVLLQSAYTIKKVRLQTSVESVFATHTSLATFSIGGGWYSNWIFKCKTIRKWGTLQCEPVNKRYLKGGIETPAFMDLFVLKSRSSLFIDNDVFNFFSHEHGICIELESLPFVEVACRWKHAERRSTDRFLCCRIKNSSQKRSRFGAVFSVPLGRKKLWELYCFGSFTF